jgi:hypothetical protein
VGFVVDKSALGQVFPCKFHSTGAALLGKTKKKHLSSSSQGCTISLTTAVPFSIKKEEHDDI